MDEQIKILYEDKDVWVCVKPVGYSSEDSGGSHVNSLPASLRRMSGADYAGVVHRLDTAVGGVMVYAKNKKAAANLSKQVQDGIMKKEYRATVHGTPPQSGVLEDLLFHDRFTNKTFVADKQRSGVKKASLEYKTLSSEIQNGEALTTVEILLHTGRTHQIRVQFASRGFPLVGDGKYGAKDGCKTIALEAFRLTFKLPSSGKLSAFENNE